MSDNNYATLQSIEKQQHKQTLEHERNASLHSIKIAALVKKAVRDVNSSNNKYKQQQKPQQQQQQNSGCIGDMYTGAKIVAQTIGKNCNTNCGTTTTNCGNNSCDEDTVVDNNTLNGALSTITEVSIEESIVIDSADSIMHSLADDNSFRRSLSPTPRGSGSARVRAVPVSPNSIGEDEGWQQKSIQWIDDVLPSLCSPVAQVCGGVSSSLNNEPPKKRSYARYYSNKGFCIPQDHEEPSTVPRTMSPQTTLAGTLSNDEETTTLPSIISDNEQEQGEDEEDENDISVTLNNLTSISDHLLNKKQQQQDHQQVTHEDKEVKEGRLEERLQPSMYSYTNDTSSLSDYILKKQEEMQQSPRTTRIDKAGFPTLESSLNNNLAYKSQKRAQQQTDELQCLDECLLNNKNIPCDEQKQDAITQFATSSVNILSYVMSPLVSGDICNTRYNGIISDKCSVCATTIGTNDDDTMTTIISEHTKKQMEVERRKRESMKESMDMEITIDTAETQMFLMRLSNQIPSYDMADQSTTKSQIVEEQQQGTIVTPISEALETLEEEESTTRPASAPTVVTPTVAGVNELYPTNSILQKQNTVLSDDSPDHTNVNLYQVFDDKSIKSDKVEEIVSSLSNESGTRGGSLASPSAPLPPPPALPFEQRKQLLKTNDNGMIDKGLLDVMNSRSSVSCRLGIAPVHSMDSQSVTDDEEEDDDYFYAPAYTPTALPYGENKFGKTTSSLSQMLIDTFHLVSVGDDDEISDIKSYHTELLLGTTPKGKSVETQLSTVSGGGEDDDPVISTNCPHDEQQKDGINNLINRWEGMTTPKQTNASSGKKTHQVVSKQQELPPTMPEIKKKLDYNVPKKKRTTAVSAKEEEEKLIQIQDKISKMKKRQLPNDEVSTPKEETKQLLDNDNTIQQQQQQEKKKTTAPSSPKPVWNNDRLKRAKMKRKERIRSRATS